MISSSLVGLLHCKQCEQDIVHTAGQLACSCKSAFTEGSTAYFSLASGSEEWARQQNESVARYQADGYEADAALGLLFGGFIGATLNREGLVIDIGCGLHPTMPHYAKELGLSHYLGIEPLTARSNRTYDCLAGIGAEDIPLRSDCANAATFATSLDHIEDAKSAVAEVLRVLKPDAPLYFWLGVHDPFVIAEDKTFGVVHNHARGLKKYLRIALSPIEHLHLAIKMRRRASDLRSGKPLDSAHVRYHTVAGIDDEMAGYGLTITRRVLVPGSASLFVEAKAS